MKIVSLGGICLEAADIKILEEHAEVILHDETPCDEQETIERIDGADIIISALCPLTKSIIEINSQLKMICLATTGCDDVDLKAADERNILVTYTPGYATQSVAEHTIGLMLSASRLSFAAAHDVREGVYNPCAYQGKQLKSKTLGVIGHGRIGKQVAKIAEGGFGMKIRTVNTKTTRKEFEAILKESDVISLHVPLTDKTRHMIGEKEFALMKEGVVIVNTARGGIIDEAALISHIKSGKIFGVGLDVIEHEPMNPKDPLFSLSNVVITPHIAFNSDEAIIERSHIVTQNILQFLAGTPQNVVKVYLD